MAENESYRVDEINLFEKFQSIGVGDPRRRWLMDRGATCHIITFLFCSTLLRCNLFAKRSRAEHPTVSIS